MTDLTESEIAYIAGVIDGEGCLQAYLKNDHLQLRVEVGSTCPELANWLREKVGGHVSSWQRRNKKERRIYLWRVHTGLAVPLLERLLPYLIIKKRQAELFLELADTRKTPKEGRHVAKHVHERRLRLVGEIRDDKRRVA